MPGIIIQRKTAQSPFEYCELKHGRRRMLHFIASVSSSSIHTGLCASCSILALYLTHMDAFGDPLLFLIYGWLGTMMPLSHFWHVTH